MADLTRRYDGDEPQRINRWLAQAGVCSRREAETLVAEGRVRIDGEAVTDPGRKILPGQTLTLAEAGGGAADGKISVLIHKPVGMVSAQPEPGQVPAARLLTRQNMWGPGRAESVGGASLAPLGRLDKDSRGLLLLSDDGVLAKAVIGPDSQVDKQYRVRATGGLDKAKIALLRHGLELDGRPLKRARVDRLGEQTFEITLTEGRNRQIRRMCDLVGLKVIDLWRTRVGPLQLGDLPEGRWRFLTAEERAALIAAVSG